MLPQKTYIHTYVGITQSSHTRTRTHRYQSYWQLLVCAICGKLQWTLHCWRHSFVENLEFRSGSFGGIGCPGSSLVFVGLKDCCLLRWIRGGRKSPGSIGCIVLGKALLLLLLLWPWKGDSIPLTSETIVWSQSCRRMFLPDFLSHLHLQKETPSQTAPEILTSR